MTMAGGTIQGDEGAVFGIARTNLIERGLGPGNPCRRAQRRLWLGCRSDIGGDAKAAANSAPEVESRAVLLITAEETEADHDGNYNHAYRRSPPDLGPGIVKLEGALLTRHHRPPALVGASVTS